MSGWQVGDLALCVKGGELVPSRFKTDTPEQGKTYRVERYIPNAEFITGTHPALELAAGPINVGGDSVWVASRFRKIKPDTEPCEEEFTVLIKRGRKVQA
jgi:hypothetical protein